MKNAQRTALATVILTIFLIALGAYVRATHSGLGCPDWPTCHGGVVPPNGRHSIIETTHRYVGTIVGLLVIATAFLAWRSYRRTPFVLWTAIAAVPLVGVQGILGAITVLRELPPEIVATHLLFAMLLLSCEIAVVVAMYCEDPDHLSWARAFPRADTRRIGGVALVATVWFAAVLWVGGYLAESGGSMACSGWPTCNGSVLPSSDHHEIFHMIHRYLAGFMMVFVIPLVVIAWRRRSELSWAAPIAVATGVLYGVQVLLGALDVWYTFPGAVTVSHTAVAACLWAVLSTAVALSFYLPAGEGRVAARVPAAASV
jgi:heme A synthase